MKIRTFLICEDIDIKRDTKEIVIKRMLSGLTVKKIPTKESVVFLMTFDEVEQQEKKLVMTLLNSREKAVKVYNISMKPEQNAFSIKIELEFPETGEYSFKFSYDGNFLGKYPFSIKERGDDHES